MKLSPQDVESLKDSSVNAGDAGWNGFSYVNNEAGNMEMALYNWLLAYDSDPERKESILEVIPELLRLNADTTR